MFVRPTSNDLCMVKELLECFGHVSGLRCNLSKRAATPIQCSDEDIALVCEELSCGVVNFPSTYLGLPTTLNKPAKSVLLPLVDKVADKLPRWKALLLNHAGRLVVVKSDLTTTLIHLVGGKATLDMSFEALLCGEFEGYLGWVFRAIDKLRRGFMWKGHEQAQGGSCLVSWAKRPLRYGGIDVHDLECFGVGIAHSVAVVTEDRKDRALFDVAVDTTVGDGVSTKFWADCWLQGKTLAEWAPNLFSLIPTRIVQRRTVSQALSNRRWVDDIK
ncbi:LOW QUALITY PROTEIN: hypothetical protein U9M48_023801 [Paspalum notatum var. saurae]|uniref:Reverse transcriptase n=1 Tax=Paspalum notatum var. saurae TaxID=547442 RepID=A0AAQ3TMG8_PASNO